MSDQTKHDGQAVNQQLQVEAVALLENHQKWINKLPVPTTGATHQMMNVVGKAIETLNRMNLEASAPKRPLQEGEINDEWHAAGGKETGKGTCLVIDKWQYHKLRRAIAEATPQEQAARQAHLAERHAYLQERAKCEQLEARIADLELVLFAENQKRQEVELARDQALVALKAITYESGGRYFVGRHGDTDVTDEVAAAIAAAELFGNSEQLPDSTTTQPSGNSGELPTTAQPAVALDGWTPIDSAPKDGRTMLLGYFNSHGKWRTMRGQWFTKEYIDDNWENGDLFEAGWYETSVEADDVPSCWPTKPTHWMPTPTAP